MIALRELTESEITLVSGGADYDFSAPSDPPIPSGFTTDNITGADFDYDQLSGTWSANLHFDSAYSAASGQDPVADTGVPGRPTHATYESQKGSVRTSVTTSHSTQTTTTSPSAYGSGTVSFSAWGIHFSFSFGGSTGGSTSATQDHMSTMRKVKN